MNEFMRIANELAEENLTTNAGGPFGACVVRNGEIIGRGANKVISENDPTAHAEINAIRDACKNIGSHDLSNCEIYTSCYPCPMCLSAIIWANIKKVYYGNTKEDAAEIGFRDDFIYEYIKNGNSDTNVLSLESMDREETIKVFDEYKDKDDKVNY
jgi:tRNA(Arg) A34 adenosine deaminase TadA